MPQQTLTRLNQIALALLLPVLFVAGVWALFPAPSTQAQSPTPNSQSPDPDLWRTLETPFETVGKVLEDKEGNIWVVSLAGTFEGNSVIPGETVESAPPPPTPLPTAPPVIQKVEVPVEREISYTLPYLGVITQSQLLVRGAALLGVAGAGAVGVVWWRKRRRTRQNVARRVNPYIAGSPIDRPELFYGREELLQRLIQGVPGNHIALEGPRRSGKSSLLKQLARRLRALSGADYYFAPVYFDCHATTEADFFYDLMGAIIAALTELKPDLSLPPLNYRPLGQDQTSPAYDNRHFKEDLSLILAALAKIIPQDIRIVLLVDEGDALNEYDKVTQRKIRNLISQHQAIKMVWAGTNILAAGSDPTSPWYNLQLSYALPPLPEAEALTLITQPAAKLGYTYQPEASQRILERAQGQPYIIQYLGYRAVEAMLDQKRATINLADVEEAITELEQELSAKDPASVVYQSRPQPGLVVAENKTPYQTDKDDPPHDPPL